MLADFFTKPLQGALFRFFRDIIMGYTSITDILDDHPKIKERVEKWKKYKYAIISNIDKRTDENNVRTSKYVESSNDETINTQDTISTSNDDTRRNSTYVKNKTVRPTYAQIAKRAIHS